MKYRLTNGTVIGENDKCEKDILISNAKIEALINRAEPSSGDYEIIDCKGTFVSAGFVDIHQHGGGGSDYMDTDPDTYFNATEAHLAHGTTSVMPTTVSGVKSILLDAVESYKRAKRDTRIRANLLGLHMEGRYISPVQAGAMKPENISVFNEEEYKEIIEAADGNIKRWSVAPELEGAEKFAKYALDNQITLSIGHSNADFDTVLRAYDMGFRHVTHLYSCTSTITRKNGFRIPGVLEAAYYLDDMNVEIIADGCHLPISLLSYVAKFKNHDRISIITDAMRAAGQDVTHSFLGSPDDPLPVIVEDGVAKLEDRSAFGGSVATSDRLVRNMIKSGVSLCDAIKMITINPLKSMNLNVKKGLIKEGYDADICVFDSDINVKAVICNGKLAISDL